MFKINRQAKCVLDKLTEELNEPGDHREIDKAPGFMSVHIEHIGDCNLGPMFSVAHYFLQNGDMMKDPDMTSLRDQSGDYYPLEFQKDRLSWQTVERSHHLGFSFGPSLPGGSWLWLAWSCFFWTNFRFDKGGCG